jgi:hypothetical protein
VSWRSGFPLDILAYYTAGSTNNAPGPSGAGDGGITRANLEGSAVRTFDPRLVQKIGGTPGHYYFSPHNFAQPAEGEGNYGRLRRNAFCGPGRVNSIGFGEIR